MSLELLPDPGEAFRLFAVAQPELVAIAGQRVALTLSGDEPAIRYALIGGTAGWGEGDPRLQAECWGKGGVADDGTASRLARTLVAVLPRMRGAYAGGWVSGAAPDGHPFDSPDPSTHRPRQIVPVRLLTHSLEE